MHTAGDSSLSESSDCDKRPRMKNASTFAEVDNFYLIIFIALFLIISISCKKQAEYSLFVVQVTFICI